MKKRTNIVRIFGLFMLVAVLLNSITPARAIVKEQLDSQQSAKNAKDAADNHDEQPTFSESSSDVVVPSHAFSFDNGFIIIPAPEFNFIFSEKAAYKIVKPLYRHSYFDKLYELHIAINAP